MNREEISLNLVEYWGNQNGTAGFETFVDNYLECLEKIGYIDDLKKEIKQLKDNWNKLKDYIINIQQTYFAWDEILDKVEELEKGDSNE